MKLPIGISNLSKIRKDNAYYVDKTAYVSRLVEEGTYYFLSRPRRFGKSLLVDTMKEAFSANRELFKGLYLEDHWDWDTAYPVILISFGGGVLQTREALDNCIDDLLNDNAESLQISLKRKTISGRFKALIKDVVKRYGQRVVILVDEYDKPLLDNIADTLRAADIREGLKNLYSVIKDCDGYIHFCFFTGVSKFSKVSLFSGLNNLEDITLAPEFGAICGYTQHELETVFADRLGDSDLEKIRRWYNGYSFLGETVYTPFDVLLHLKHQKFQNYWFETATPGFLIKLLHQRRFYLPRLERLRVGEELLGSFEIEDIVAETLLFQSGYLTIKAIEEPLPDMIYYVLGYPNYEVKTSLNTYLINDLSGARDQMGPLRYDLSVALAQGRLPELRQHLQALFAAIPHDWYRKNDLDRYEGYYASVVYACLASLGFDLIAEDTSNHGRADLTLLTEKAIYVFEFKVIELVKDAGGALAQIKENGYHEKYLNQGKPVYLIGIGFSRVERNIVGFVWELIES